MYRRAQGPGGGGTTLGGVVTITGTPAAGAVLRATSATAAAWGTLDLSDTDAITGTLPEGNQANQTLAGDCTGASSNNVVAKIKGITVTNGNTSVTVGNTLCVTSTAATPDEATFQALLLSGGTGYVSGALPALNGGLGADGSAYAGFGFWTAGAHTVTTYLTQGGTVSSTGTLGRLANGQNLVAMRNAANSADVGIIDTDTSNRIWFGCNKDTGALSAQANLFGTISQMGSSTTTKWKCDTTALQAVLPIIGLATVFGVHGGVTKAFPSDANYVVLNTEYIYNVLEFTTGSITTGRTVTFPHPATDAAGYEKLFINSTNQTITVSTGTGATKAVIATVTNAVRLRFSTAGVTYAGPTYTYS